MKNMLFLTLFFTLGFDLYAGKYNSCVGSDCEMEDPNFINIAGLEKRDVFEALYNHAIKRNHDGIIKNPAKYLNREIDYTLRSEYFWKAEYEWNWNIEKIKVNENANIYVNMKVDLSQDVVNVKIFNVMYGPNAAQKAIEKLKSQKVLLS